MTRSRAKDKKSPAKKAQNSPKKASPVNSKSQKVTKLSPKKVGKLAKAANFISKKILPKKARSSPQKSTSPVKKASPVKTVSKKGDQKAAQKTEAKNVVSKKVATPKKVSPAKSKAPEVEMTPRSSGRQRKVLDYNAMAKGLVSESPEKSVKRKSVGSAKEIETPVKKSKRIESPEKPIEKAKKVVEKTPTKTVASSKKAVVPSKKVENVAKPPQKIVETKKAQSPKKIVAAPKMSESPKKAPASPRRPTRSPTRQVKEIVEEVVSPSRPKRSASPKKESESPKKAPESPKKTPESPKKAPESPKKAPESPKKTSESSEKTTESPKKAQESAKKAADSPKKAPESPIKSKKSAPEPTVKSQFNIPESPKQIEEVTNGTKIEIPPKTKVIIVEKPESPSTDTIKITSVGQPASPIKAKVIHMNEVTNVSEGLTTRPRCHDCPGCLRKPCNECSFCKNGQKLLCIDRYCMNTDEGRKQREEAKAKYLASLSKSKFDTEKAFQPDRNLTIQEQVDMIMSQLQYKQKSRPSVDVSARVITGSSKPRTPQQNGEKKVRAKHKMVAVYGSSERASKSRRCGECEGCMRDDCGQCPACRDKPRFGGKGSKKKACMARSCRMRGPPPQGQALVVTTPQQDNNTSYQIVVMKTDKDS